MTASFSSIEDAHNSLAIHSEYDAYTTTSTATLSPLTVDEFYNEISKIDWVGKIRLDNPEQAKGWDEAIKEMRKYIEERL